ncbi:MAG: hypothetical protein HY899_09445 [Deltaproteobacteria bacterium]|nr:hypothetical protein [Deltaproteobacteria bacterium]
MIGTLHKACIATVCLLLAAVGPARAAVVSSPQVAAGFYHTCGLREDGSVTCWGRDLEGQTTVPPGTYIQVSAGRLHTCGLLQSGAVVCWGDNSHLQCEPPAGTFTQVSAGGDHNCAMRPDGTLACWGYDASGQASPPSGTFTQLSSGAVHTCALRADGTAQCWGNDDSGQATPPADIFTNVASGAYHSCGLHEDDSVVCWGRSSEGQATPPPAAFSQVSPGGYHSCGLRTDGGLACWGYDAYGQATPPAGIFTYVSSGFFHSCGVRDDGSLACWGYDGYGQSTPPVWTRGCGDGIPQAGEDCDDGNTVDGDCCSATCLAETAGSPCTADANVCTDDVCDGAGTCGHPDNTAPCSDGLYCTDGDVCSGGVCRAGAARNCNDANVCTTDSCNETIDACVHANNALSCDDGLYCTTGDVCSGGVCGGAARNCADTNVCTTDSCDEDADSCVHPDNTLPCNDGLYCTAGDVCAGGTCAGAPRDCGDANACTDDSCNEAGDACDHSNNTMPCDDGLYCTTVDVCAGGVCSGPSRDCADSNLCTDDSCNEASDACDHLNNSLPCDDGLYCTDGDVCAAGTCASGAPRDCGDANGCTDDSCNDATDACDHADNTAPCEDGLYCTVGEVCAGGACGSGSSRDCADANGCTDDSCNETGDACDHLNNTLPCDDGLNCTDGDVCSGGICAGGPALACDDANPCTDDSCDAGTDQCAHQNNTLPCDDGLYCTAGDACAAGACGGAPRDCSDANLCTTDSCDEIADTCTSQNNTLPCDDGLFCTDGDVCSAGACAGQPRGCDDTNQCTDDSCNESADSCDHAANAAACDDADFCNGADTCSGGTCALHAGDPCSGWPTCNGTCDNLLAQCAGVVGQPCDDGDLCTSGDSCDGPGVCTSGSPIACDDGEPCTQDSCDPATGLCDSKPEPQRRSDDQVEPGNCRVAADTAAVVSHARGRSKIKWKWRRGEATDPAAFGDPLTDTRYTLCIYDQSGGVFSIPQADPAEFPGADSGIDVGGGAGWMIRSDQGYWYRDKTCGQEGIAGVNLTPDESGKASVTLKAVGSCLPIPLRFSEEKYFDFDPAVVIQLVNSEGQCWDSTFDDATSVRENSGRRFKSKAVVRLDIP